MKKSFQNDQLKTTLQKTVQSSKNFPQLHDALTGDVLTRGWIETTWWETETISIVGLIFCINQW